MGRRPVQPVSVVRIVRYTPVLSSARWGDDGARPSSTASSGRGGTGAARPLPEVPAASFTAGRASGAPSGWRPSEAPETDGALALNQTPSHARPPRPLRLVQPGETVQTELRARAEATVRIIVDVLSGARPGHQLSQVAVPAVCQELERLYPPRGRAVPSRPATPGRGTAPQRAASSGSTVPPGAHQTGRVVPGRVLSSWLQRPAPDVAEVGAVVVVAGRVRALALRLELVRGRWRCTAVETTGP
ncbi:Rv3235 family protein [Actinomadura terrae]|uniref:Rv3235 family protein n=1 Tax=Actinomadura terrae TaxID=604353 RepID=UPI001FA7227A|nr:Rv3235 family protein [Actinomadura terrae]